MRNATQDQQQRTSYKRIERSYFFQIFDNHILKLALAVLGIKQLLQVVSLAGGTYGGTDLETLAQRNVDRPGSDEPRTGRDQDQATFGNGGHGWMCVGG